MSSENLTPNHCGRALSQRLAPRVERKEEEDSRRKSSPFELGSGRARRSEKNFCEKSVVGISRVSHIREGNAFSRYRVIAYLSFTDPDSTSRGLRGLFAREIASSPGGVPIAAS